MTTPSRTQSEWDALGCRFQSPFDVLTAFPSPTTPCDGSALKPKRIQKPIDKKEMLLRSLENEGERTARLRARQPR